MYARMDVRIRMYICTVCMWERVTYPSVPFALDLEGGAGRSKSQEGHGARDYAAV